MFAAPRQCSVEGFRQLLNVECDTAIVVANLIGVCGFVMIMCIAIIFIKRRCVVETEFCLSYGVTCLHFQTMGYKKRATFLSISSPIIDRFSKFFHCCMLWTVSNKVAVKYPTIH